MPEEGPSRFERWVLPYVQEPLLHPVLFTILAFVALGVAVLGVLLVRDRNPFAGLGLVACLAATVGLVRQELRIAHKPGGFTLSAVLTWIGAAVLTWVFWQYDVV